MKLDLFNEEAIRIWKRLSDSEENFNDLLQLELDLYKKLLIFFQIGESCYLIFNFQQIRFDLVSEEVKTVLGYDRKGFSADHILQNIHPDDRTWFLNCQEACNQFLFGMSPQRQMKYKFRMDYRIRKQSGEYIRVMHQAITIQNDDDGKVIRCLVVITDINHLKKDGKPVLSYIGMDGEPSYLDVDVKNHFQEESHLLSKREKEILYLLGEGKASKQIADLLNISKHTVDSHRKNLLRKTGATSTIELISKTIREGLI